MRECPAMTRARRGWPLQGSHLHAVMTASSRCGQRHRKRASRKLAGTFNRPSTAEGTARFGYLLHGSGGGPHLDEEEYCVAYSSTQLGEVRFAHVPCRICRH